MKTSLIGSDNLEIDAVVPQCLDNQYVSDRVFTDLVKRKVDFRDEDIAKEREKDFRTEFIRSLTYSSQVIIQRAYFKNSKFLYKNYLPEDGENLNAFAKMIREKAVVPYLFKESSLLDKLEFDVSEEGDRALRALLDAVGDEVTCVRLAVDDAANKQSTDSMATEFGVGLVRLDKMNNSQRNAIASELFTDPQRLQEEGCLDAFDAALDRLVDYTNSKARILRKSNDKLITRQDIYRDNFIVEGKGNDNVVNGKFKQPDSDNPFMLELKKYVDLVYNTNLPDHLHRYTFTPANMPSRLALQDAPASVKSYGHEQVSSILSDNDALEHIRRTFVAHTQKAMSLPLLHDLSVADVIELRSLPEWNAFNESQSQILKNPLQCLNLIETFQNNFNQFQNALSDWYNHKYERVRTEEKYCSAISLALNLGGKLIVAGSNLGPYEKAIGMFASDRIVSNIPEKIENYSAKLLVGVYDIGKQKLDSNRTYSIELMRANTELMREDIVELLDSVYRKNEFDMPIATDQIADQGK